MTIVIVGAGAIGLLVAGHLVQAGQHVVVLARSTAATLAAHGLHLAQNGQNEQIPLHVATHPDELAESDRAPSLAILTVKGYDTAGALPTLAALAPQRILTLQNGLGNEEQLVERFGPQPILSGVITTSVEVATPHQITVTKVGGIGLAPIVPGEDVARWAGVFAQAGFATRTYSDYRAMKWSKVLLNMLGNASAAILDLPVATVYADARLVALERQAFLEALTVMERMRARPVDLPRYPAALLARVMQYAPAPLLRRLLQNVIAEGRGGKPPSLHADLLRGNPRSEGKFLYGAVAEAATRRGLEAPVNHTLWAILEAIATGRVAWDTYRGQPERLLAAVAQPDHELNAHNIA